MKPIVIAVLILIATSAVVGGLTWPTQITQTLTPAMTSYAWGGTPLSEIDVSSQLTNNVSRSDYIRAAAIRQHALVELYETGTVEIQGYTFQATSPTITAIKTEFAALRTRIKRAEDAMTAD